MPTISCGRLRVEFFKEEEESSLALARNPLSKAARHRSSTGRSWR
jgi:hypothetical protein